MSTVKHGRLISAGWLALAMALAGAASAASAATSEGYAQRPEVRAFIAELVAEDGFEEAALRRLFAKARYQPKVIEAISRPLLSPPTWYDYSARFLDPERIEAGHYFWREHAAALSRAENELGVPAQVIVAVLGVETYYGRNVGSFPVFDTLTTLAFDYPRRAVFFRSELKSFLLLAREQGVSPLAAYGSYAGAMGPGQFMPSSIRTYGIDFDADGRVDLIADMDDVIGSIAVYLSRFGWQRGQPIMEPARVDTNEPEQSVLRQLDDGMSDRRPLADWVREGITGFAIPGDLAPDPVGVLLLEGEGAPSYWLVFNNWYVLRHYNPSRLYASAVAQLAQALQSATERGP